MAERELSLNLSDDARDLLVEKGWDPAMGARPLRRAIQRYIEDPLADEVLRASDMKPGATVEVDAVRGELDDDGKEKDPEVKISITAPKREPVSVGAGESGGGELPSGSGSGTDSLPDDPEVLPDVPDAPPAEGSAPEGDPS
jgi:ATP-dependent Clp protease ATP-binding subunit ClpC